MISPFAFATSTEIRFGRGEAARAVDAIAALGPHILLVSGANPDRAGWLGAARRSQRPAAR